MVDVVRELAEYEVEVIQLEEAWVGDMVTLLQELAPEYGAERRRVRVTKYRGRRFRGGYHDMRIVRGGIEVYPRLVASEHHTEFSGDFTASEFQFSVGLAFNEFLFDNSVLTVRYGSWAGTNVDAGIGTHAGSNASLIHRGDVNNTGDQFVNGWEAIWDYYDLQFAYGVYLSDDGRGASAGQVFRVRYTVDF